MFCNGCLKVVNDERYCPKCIKTLWNSNRKISINLDFDRNAFIKIRRKYIERLSISGIQDKISLKIKKDKLVHTNKNGEYILKPAPTIDVPRFLRDIPANEHLTMQIADQVFKINTAKNGTIKFSDGELAYITKRFDLLDNMKLGQEDFCQLSNRSEDTHGKNYKYDSSYEEAGNILYKYCSAGLIEIEKLFFLILFNYVIGNGDAHLKNFSLLESTYGDYLLSPAYDLISTTVHFPDESRTALELFEDYETESYIRNGFYKRTDFLELAMKYNIKEERAIHYIGLFHQKQNLVLSLIDKSFLSKEAKIAYTNIFTDRLRAVSD